MDFNLPLETIHIEMTQEEVGNLSASRLSRPRLKVDEDDFFLDVENIACYRVQNGNKIFVNPNLDADLASVQLFLNGSVLGAVLHQRRILPFHGSSFVYMGKGIIICGQSGTGKSSITAAFCQKGGCFITDDITPVRITGSATNIIPIKTRIKLWDDSLRMLNIENEQLEKIRPILNKYYLPVQEVYPSEQRLNHLFILFVHNKEEYVVNELDGMEKFYVLRKQIYRSGYLKGMPATEQCYFKQLFQIAATIRVTVVIRPQICDVYETMNCIQKEVVR